MSYDDVLKIYAGIDSAGVESGMKDIDSIVGKGMSVLKSGVSAGFSVIDNAVKVTAGAIASAASGVLAFGTYSVQAGKDFESGMSQVIATMGITKDTIQDGVNSYDMLSEKAKEMGATTKFSAGDAADALNYLALAGYDAVKACDALPSVLNLAQAGGMDLAYTSDLVTDAMSALQIEATTENLTHFGDVLSKTASNSNTSVAQLGEAILVCGGQAKLAGLELEDMSTMLGILADNGIKGSEGGTALRNLLKNMYTPTTQASKAMEELNITVSDAEGNLKSAQGVLMDTMSALENLSEADRMQFMADIFDTRTIAAASAALNNSTDRYNELKEAITDCDGAMQQMAETQNDNLSGDWAGMKSALESVGVEVYESLNSSLRDTVQLGTSYLRDMTSAFKENGFDGLALSLGNAFGDAVSLASEKIPDFLKIGSSAVKSLLQGIDENSGTIGKSVSDMIFIMSDSVMDIFPQLFKVGGKLVSELADGLSERSQELSEKAEDIVIWIYDGIVDNIPKLIETGADIVKKLSNSLSEKSDSIVSSGVRLVKVFAKSVTDNAPVLIRTAKQLVRSFATAVGEEIPVLKPFADVILLLSDNFETVAGTVAVALATVKGFKAVSSIVSTVKTTATAVSGFISAFSVAPVLLVVAGIGALGYALHELSEETKSNKFPELTDEIERQSETISKNKDRMNELGQSAKETADKEQLHLDKVESLWQELDRLSDASGRVRDADKDRAEYILGELNNALGTEYSMVDNQIQQYDKLKSSIQDVIAQKRAEVLISAYSGRYEEALTQQSDTQKTESDSYRKRQQLQSAMDEFKKKLAVYEDQLLEQGVTVDDILSGNNAYNYLNSDGRSKTVNEIRDILRNVSDVETDYGTFSLEDFADLRQYYVEASNNYAEARRDLDSINEVISNYEQASAEAIAGNYENVADYLNYRRSSETEWSELAKSSEEEVTRKIQAEIDSRETDLKLANERYVRDTNMANREMLDNAKSSLEEYLVEVDKMGFGDFLNGNQKDIVEQYNKKREREIAQERVAEWQENGYTPNSLSDYKYYSTHSYKDFAGIKILESASQEAEKKFQELEKQFADGVNDVTESMVQESKKIAEDKKAELYAAYDDLGQSGIHGLTNQMTDYENIRNAAEILGNNLESAIGDKLSDTYIAGGTIGENLLAGVCDALQNSGAVQTVENAVQTSVDMLTGLFRSKAEIHSPSKLMEREVGRWLLPGIAEGIEDTVPETADSLLDSIADVLSSAESIEYNPEISAVETPEFENIQRDIEVTFSQHVEVMRELAESDSISDIDSRITDEMQLQIEQLSVKLNADDFISKFENITSSFGQRYVPQYSEVYTAVQSQENKADRLEISGNTDRKSDTYIYIGDEQIKDFVVSTINEANAVSGGASF